MIAFLAFFKFFVASNRWTINWSVPCEAIERNAPPIIPAIKVYGLLKNDAKPSEKPKLIISNFLNSDETEMIWFNPPGIKLINKIPERIAPPK